MLNWRSIFRSTTLALPALCLLPSCAGLNYIFPSGADKDAGFVQVDDLLARVERVHVSCELAGQNVTESLTTLMQMVGPEFRGDPTLAYEDLMAAIELSEKQAEDLRENFVPMQKSAGQVFENWQMDLDAFTSDVMRQHSEERMGASRARYDAIVDVVAPALERYEAFNGVLRDHALYLGNDFNSESVELIEKQLRILIEESESLTAEFDKCTEACQAYVRKAALRGQVSPRARKSI